MAILSLVAVASCQRNYPALSMDANQIKAVSNDTLCGTSVCSHGRTTAVMWAEMKRRGISCMNITYNCTFADPSIRSSAVAASQGGPRITNNSSAVCAGMEIIEAGEEMYSGIVPGFFVKVRNNSGQRKWLQADIKYTQETLTALQHTQDTYWETTKPLIMRPDTDNTSVFWVKVAQGTPVRDQKMVEVRVIGCGT